MMCPRCSFDDFNTLRLKRKVHDKYFIVPVNKCKNKNCGFAWIADYDKVELSKKELEQLFIYDLRRL